jgi:pilus assembly protein Flp/PilA
MGALRMKRRAHRSVIASAQMLTTAGGVLACWSNTGADKIQRQFRSVELKLRNHEGGATAVEYALMVALIAVVIIVAVKLLGTNLSTLFNKTATSI